MFKRRKKPKCPFKPPKPPRCLCNALGFISPSLYFKYALMPGACHEADEYFKADEKYAFDVLQWKIQKRIATKEEYNRFIRMKKSKEINKHLEGKTPKECMEYGMQRVQGKVKSAFAKMIEEMGEQDGRKTNVHTENH